MRDFFDELISTIKQKTPPDTNPVDVLIAITPMSKEAAYRRLRREVDFSLEDVIRIARHFDISIDKLINKKETNERYSVEMFCVSEPEMMIDRYRQFLKEYITIFKQLNAASNPKAILISNIFTPDFHVHKYSTVMRYYVYRWLYKSDDLHNSVRFKDFRVPDDIVELHRGLAYELQKTNLYHICSQEIVHPLVAELGYYRLAGMMDADDINDIKQDLIAMFHQLEKVLSHGNAFQGRESHFYISRMSVANSFIYYENDIFHAVTVHFFGNGFYYFTDERVCQKFRSVLDSMINNSTLITVSGEKQRMEFLHRQREILNTL